MNVTCTMLSTNNGSCDNNNLNITARMILTCSWLHLIHVSFFIPCVVTQHLRSSDNVDMICLYPYN